MIPWVPGCKEMGWNLMFADICFAKTNLSMYAKCLYHLRKQNFRPNFTCLGKNPKTFNML